MWYTQTQNGTDAEAEADAVKYYESVKDLAPSSFALWPGASGAGFDGENAAGAAAAEYQAATRKSLIQAGPAAGWSSGYHQLVPFYSGPAPQGNHSDNQNTTSFWIAPSYSSPPAQDPSKNSHSSYTVSYQNNNDNANSNNSSGGGGNNGSRGSHQPYPQLQQSLIMHYPLGYNPQTPPQQTAGYYPTGPPTVQQQQQYPRQQYPQRRRQQQQQQQRPMMPTPPPPQHQPQPPMPSMHNMTDPMQAWYNSIPEPNLGPFQPPIPPMRGTQFMPGLSAMHPVEAQYMMYIATKRWRESPHAETTFPNFAAMPLPVLSVKERREMDELKECFDTGRFPGDIVNKSQPPPPKDPSADNDDNDAAAADKAADEDANATKKKKKKKGCCHHCCGKAADASSSSSSSSSPPPPPPPAPPSPPPAPASAPQDSSSSTESESEEDAEVRRHKDWTDHAWFDVFGKVYPPRRRFRADPFWSRRDCRVLAIMESKYEGVKWDEFAAQFCNATGRYVPPYLIQYKMESDGVPIGSDDEEEEDDDYDDDDDTDSSSSSDEEGDDEDEVGSGSD